MKKSASVFFLFVFVESREASVRVERQERRDGHRARVRKDLLVLETERRRISAFERHG